MRSANLKVHPSSVGWKRSAWEEQGGASCARRRCQQPTCQQTPGSCQAGHGSRYHVRASCGNHHHHQPGVRWCEIEVICPEMTHLVAHISISVAILTLLPGDHLDMCKWSELKIFEIVGSSAGVVKYLGFLSNWSHHSVGTTPQKH